MDLTPGSAEDQERSEKLTPDADEDRLYLDLKGARERLCRAQTGLNPTDSAILGGAIDRIDLVAARGIIRRGAWKLLGDGSEVWRFEGDEDDEHPRTPGEDVTP